MIEDIKNCKLCDLRKTCNQVVLGDGKNKKIFIVGEAPGEEEDKTGFPFVGASGKLLRSVVSDNYYITNVVKCRPPQNRKPTDEEIDICVRANFKQEFDTYKPEKLILLGKSAEKLLEFDFISGIDYIQFPHPSYYLRKGKGEEWKMKFAKVLQSKTQRVDEKLGDWFD